MAYRKTHQPCNECGSSDALVVNEDGSTKCFSCDKFHPPLDEIYEEEEEEDAEMEHTPMKPNLLNRGDIVALPERNISLDTCETYGVTVTTNRFKHY